MRGNTGVGPRSRTGKLSPPGSEYVLGAISLEYQLVQNELVGGIYLIDFLVVTSLLSQGHQGALGPHFGGLPRAQLAKNHDVILTLHNVANLIVSLRQQGVGDAHVVGELHLVRVGDTHRILLGNSEDTEYEDRN